MAHLGLEIPDEPISDYTTYEIINVFYLASRGRTYLGGMSVVPMRLSVRDINDVLAAHPVLMDRDVLDSCVFALDDIYMTELSAKMEKPKSK